MGTPPALKPPGSRLASHTAGGLWPASRPSGGQDHSTFGSLYFYCHGVLQRKSDVMRARCDETSHVLKLRSCLQTAVVMSLLFFFGGGVGLRAKCVQKSSNFGPTPSCSRSTSAAECTIEEEKQRQEEAVLRTPSPLIHKHISSDESEAEDAEELSEFSSSSSHPRPAAVSRLHFLSTRFLVFFHLRVQELEILKV